MPSDKVTKRSLPESTSTQSRDYNANGIGQGIDGGGSRNQHQPSRGITTFLRLACDRPICQPESTSTQSRDYNMMPRHFLFPQIKPESTSTQSRDYNNFSRRLRGLLPCRNQHQPSRGITTVRTWPRCLGLALPESTSTQSRDYNNLYAGAYVRSHLPESTSTQSRDYNWQAQQL